MPCEKQALWRTPQHCYDSQAYELGHFVPQPISCNRSAWFVPVLYKLFLDKWDGQTQVVPGLPGSGAAGTPPVIVGRR